MVAIFCFLSSMAAFAQNVGPTLYPVIGGHESLPLRVVSKSSLANSASRTEYPPAIPCQFGGTIGNFTIVLNCDGNDSDGTSSYGAVPDTDLAVGDQYYVQTVDNVFTIYNKVDGSVAEGPLPLTTFWNGFQNQSCVTAGAGDDFIVRYDNTASRWVVGLPIFGDAQGKYWLCLAFSTSSDPTGSYYQYAVQEADPANLIWDYPKLGVWTDAYYIGFNMISPKPVYVGPRACAVDRTSMLQGLPAAPMQCFSKRAITDSFMLPSDIAGRSQPASGEPAFFLDIAHSSTGVHSTLNLWQFHIDFTNSQNSTFSGPTALTVSTFMEGPGYVFEPGRGLLDTRSDRLMVPLAWRPTADGVEHLLVTDAIGVSGTNMTEQWFDITNPNGSPAVAQQGTLVLDPHDNFWMGSLNMDKDGDIALGFSNASARIDPGIMFTGRLFADPLNTMEAVQPVIAGTGYQSETQFQWGDHSFMAVDPSDDCTFWYSNEYYTAANTNSDRWSTRIMAFKFTACQ
jgi:hypothetical protein